MSTPELSEDDLHALEQAPESAGPAAVRQAAAELLALRALVRDWRDGLARALRRGDREDVWLAAHDIAEGRGSRVAPDTAPLPEHD